MSLESFSLTVHDQESLTLWALASEAIMRRACDTAAAQVAGNPESLGLDVVLLETPGQQLFIDGRDFGQPRWFLRTTFHVLPTGFGFLIGEHPCFVKATPDKSEWRAMLQKRNEAAHLELPDSLNPPPADEKRNRELLRFFKRASLVSEVDFARMASESRVLNLQHELNRRQHAAQQREIEELRSHIAHVESLLATTGIGKPPSIPVAGNAWKIGAIEELLKSQDYSVSRGTLEKWLRGYKESKGLPPDAFHKMGVQQSELDYFELAGFLDWIGPRLRVKSDPSDG